MLMARQDENKDFEKCPQGNHIAVCFSVIDMGMQDNNFQGKITQKRKVRISWEIPGQLMTEGEFAGQPFSIAKTYTLSLSEKAILYKDLISWRGKAFTKEELAGFDLLAILGKACLVNVIHNVSDDGQKTYVNVAGVSQLPKGMGAPPIVNPIRKFSIDDQKPGDFEALPKWLQEKINLELPHMEHVKPAPVPQAPPLPEDGDPMDNFDDDIPF